MIKVVAKPSEPIDQLLKRFKKICEKEGITRDIKKSAFYEKPSEIRRRKSRQSERKRAKLQREADQSVR